MPDINVNKLSEILNTKADIDLNNTGVFSTSGGGVNLVQSTSSDAKGKEVVSADFSLKQGGLELMDIVFAPLGIDESENKRRYLNGQVISQSQFPAFTSAVKARMSTMANAFTTEVNWQAEKTNSKLGQCGKFVVDDTTGTIRLPCVVNAQGLADLSLIGGIKNESLPNITGTFNAQGPTTGVFEYVATGNVAGGGGSFGVVTMNASKASSAYQDNAPVQQEAVQYPYCIQVATSVEETLPAIREYQLNNPFFFGQSMWSDVDPNNASWLISAGQWNAKATYPDYYDWLVEQINAGIKGFKGNIGYAWKSQTADIRFWTAIRNPSVGCAVYGGVGIPFAGTVTAINPDGTLNFYEDSTGITYENLVYTESENINIEGTALGNLKFADDYAFVVNQTNQTFRLPLLNGDRVLVAKKETTESDSTWYNLYSDGWLEQGGVVANTGANRVATISLLKPYVDTNYIVTTGHKNSAGAIGVSDTGQMGTKTTSSFQSYQYYDIIINWCACGYSEVPTQSDFTEVAGLYYYVGDTVQDANVINAGAVLGQLSDKISRTATSDKELVVGWGIPDYTAGVSKSNATQYTAEVSGVLFILSNDYNTSSAITINGNTFILDATSNNALYIGLATIPIAKGDVYTVNLGRTMEVQYITFYPMRGV